MKAVIMAGGQGTRLRPLTFTIPKPLLPIGEKPILDIILKRLHSFNINEIVLAIGYGAELIKAYFGNGDKLNLKITYVHENKMLGTAGPLKLIQGLTEPVIIMNGDILTKLNFIDLFDYHIKNKADMTIAAKTYTSQLPFGTLKSNNNILTDIEEKPSYTHLISTGIYVINPNLFDIIPSDTFYTIPDFIKTLLKMKKKVVLYNYEEYWIAIEQMNQLEEAAEHFKDWVDY